MTQIAHLGAGKMLLIEPLVEPGHRCDDKLIVGEAFREGHHVRQVGLDLRSATAGQQGDNRSIVQAVLSKELFACRELLPVQGNVVG